MSKSELLPDLSSVEIDEDKLVQVAKLAEIGMSIAAVTHEIRQPLSALKIAIQMAREKVDPDDDMARDLSDALEQTSRMEGLIERTRSFLSPPKGKEEIRLGETVEGAVSMLKWQLGNTKRIELQAELKTSWDKVLADKSLIEQLVANLLINARDAVSKQGGGRILVLVCDTDSGVDLIVADNGPGIDPKVGAQVFEPFFTTKSAESGTGLGLYIVRRIASEHGARIELMSPSDLTSLDRGRLTTGFRLSFDVEREEASVTTPPPPRGDEGTPKIQRALIVDDEKPILKVLGKLLKQEGFECKAVENGEDAIALLDTEPFGLLVTDKNLPGVSGIEVAQFARNMRPFMPILLVTGYASEDSALEALSLGVSDYVVKPLDLEDFRVRLRKVMGRGRPRDTRPIQKKDSALAPGEIQAKLVVPVLLIEGSEELRELIQETLSDLGCPVKAVETDKGLDPPPPFQVLVARPEVLHRRKLWFSDVSNGVLGAIAIMDRSGVDKTIEAIHLGARGVMAPPFDESGISFDFRKTVERLMAETGQV